MQRTCKSDSQPRSIPLEYQHERKITKNILEYGQKSSVIFSESQESRLIFRV